MINVRDVHCITRVVSSNLSGICEGISINEKNYYIIGYYGYTVTKLTL
jgi:uncharacterized membrane-anchored protein